MNKLAINSFLAVTAMAWLGQPTEAQAHRMDSEARESSEVFVDERGAILRSHRYSAPERILLNEFRSRQASQVSPVIPIRTGTGNGLPPGVDQRLHPGMVLHFEQMREARMLPGDVRAGLAGSPEEVLDLYMRGKVVRILRETREVVDVLDT